jgi:hypothetical protein
VFQFVIDHPLLAYLAAGLTFAVIFTETQRWLLPLRIPATEISSLADDLIAQFGPQAAEVAELEQDRALHNSDPYEQGKWRRVEREIRRRRSISSVP